MASTALNWTRWENQNWEMWGSLKSDTLKPINYRRVFRALYCLCYRWVFVIFCKKKKKERWARSERRHSMTFALPCRHMPRSDHETLCQMESRNGGNRTGPLSFFCWFFEANLSSVEPPSTHFKSCVNNECRHSVERRPALPYFLNKYAAIKQNSHKVSSASVGRYLCMKLNGWYDKKKQWL